MDNTQKKKKSFKLPTAYTVLLIITAVIAIVTHFIAGVKPASLADFVMAPINGLNDSIDIAIFVLLTSHNLNHLQYIQGVMKTNQSQYF